MTEKELRSAEALLNDGLRLIELAYHQLKNETTFRDYCSTFENPFPVATSFAKLKFEAELLKEAAHHAVEVHCE